MKTVKKVLLIIPQCNPEWASVPLEGYSFYKYINNLIDTTLVTHERNKPDLEKIHPDRDIVYIEESQFIKQYYKNAARLSSIKSKVIWPIYHTLTYPIYAEFNNLVYRKFQKSILKGEYDIVHSITPMMPRYPVKVVKVCNKTPFMIGPVNGGVPFPKGFRAVAKQEFADFNFLRAIGRWIIPGYRETYEKADYILSGSSYTFGLIKSLFNIKDEQIELFYENGISSSFLRKEEEIIEKNRKDKNKINLLFVGRLVPYKGADILLESISKLDLPVKEKITLTIVGDGSEKDTLEQLVCNFNLSKIVNLTGWMPQKETVKYYQKCDIFCFPSVREFGGAVVLEAMANGLPCIVVNNGGIGEYVTEDTGFKIEPISREFVVKNLTDHIEKLVMDKVMRNTMSINCLKRAKEFTWANKAKKIFNIYDQVLSKKKTLNTINPINSVT